MKNKFMIIGGVVLAVILVVVLVFVMLPKDNDNVNSTGSASISDTSSDSSVSVEDINGTGSNTDSKTDGSENGFVEPDETEADKLLVENKSKPQTSDNNETESISSKVSETETFEEGQEKLENDAEAYLKAHNIAPKTAGETGEVCANCGKKIWNPDKYGFFIPGMPDDYENSGYCLGTCGVTFD